MHSSASRATEGIISVSLACEEPNARCMSVAKNPPNDSAASSGMVIIELFSLSYCSPPDHQIAGNPRTISSQGVKWITQSSPVFRFSGAVLDLLTGSPFSHISKPARRKMQICTGGMRVQSDFVTDVYCSCASDHHY